ncbi:hypothetical protein FNJ87_16950 [Nonlabens mediterrranea]|uniref:Prenyltransferase n=1 Tax=Nonlabens mediterrranea TaxID=1419947 RepID=A0ABS0A988_9FLAO|nr:hypothetical protein [Nonlabens mediterrranea]
MSLLKTILDFYIRSSLHVGICFMAMAMVYHFTYQFYVPFGYYIFLFCSAVAGYNLIKYGFIWLKNRLLSNVLYKLLSIAAAAIALIILLKLNISSHAWLLLMIVILINMLYVLPIWKGHGLRYSPFFKLFSVSIVWAILIIAIPQFLYYNTGVDTPVIIEFNNGVLTNDAVEWHTLKIFILVIALCIPFEIRDLKYDEEQLQTLPQVLGIKASKYIGLILCIFYLLLLCYSLPNVLEVIMVIITAIAIWFSDRFKSDYYSSFFVEAIPLLWLGMYYIL